VRRWRGLQLHLQQRAERTRTLNGRVEAIEIASLRKFYLETVAMPFEAERIVKSVGVFSLQIAR
jgi:hypothetical protein